MTVEPLKAARAVAQADLVTALKINAEYLDGLADIMDDWAETSQRGGWSTHQVSANKEAANGCRRRAAHIRRLLLQAT